MSAFTAKKLKELRIAAKISQEEAASIMKISRRTLGYYESNERQPTSDEIIQFAKIYNVDVRELLYESFTELSEEEILCRRYMPVIKLFEQLDDVEKGDIVWVMKQRISGKL